MVLVHDAALWDIIDDWVDGLSNAHFGEVLPLLRRTFATFAPAERRQMGQRVKHSGAGGTSAEVNHADEFDYASADAVLPLLGRILGIRHEPNERG